MQENINISDVIKVQTWIEDGIRWYPPTTINREVFGRGKISTASLINGGWGKYCKKVKLKYENSQGISVLNETTVMSEDGFKEYIQTKVVGKMDLEQKKNYNLLLEYLSVNKKIEEKPKKLEKITDEEFLKYNEYAKKIHDEITFSEYALCGSCETYYPINKVFYPIHDKYEFGVNTSICRKCIKGYIYGENVENIKNSKKYADDKIKHIESAISIVDEIKDINKKINNMPLEFYTLDNILKLFIELKNLGNITYVNFSKEKHRDIIFEFKLDFSQINKLINYYELTIKLFGINFYCRPYIYGKDRSIKRDLQDFNFQKNVFDNYLLDNNITIDDEINFNYSDIILKSHLKLGYCNKNGAIDCLDFVDRYNNFKYPAYKYKTSATNYWKIKENRIRALYFIVDELKLSDINKLPIYLTKYTLTTISRKMYNVYRKHYDNLFDWVDECYPNIFEFSDFNVDIKRNSFDSLEEMAVHEILKDKFGKKLIYNIGDLSSRFSICSGYQPDWIVLENKPIVIEYFGMFKEKDKCSTTMLMDYHNKTNNKIAEYNKLENYDKIYIYPYDLDNNYNGLHDKIKDYN